MRHSAKFLTLALQCRILIDPLLDIIESADQKSRKTAADPDGQILMFPITMERREEYTKLARTFRHFASEKVDWKATYDLDFVDYEFYAFFVPLIKEFKEDWTLVEQLEAIGAGEPLREYRPLVNFLAKIEGRALSFHASQRGGCF